MPAFDEERRLAETLADLASRAHGLDVDGLDRVSVTVFLVDDGSAIPLDEAALAESVAAASSSVSPSASRGSAPMRVVVARHPVNLGQGAALETARRMALEPRWRPGVPGADGRPPDASFEAFVTMDSDGQHGVADVLSLARAIRAGADVALGDRFAGGSDVPRARRLLLLLARTFERWTTGIRLSDAHNGLRAFSGRAIRRMRMRQNRMAHATELTRAIAIGALAEDRLRVVEVPVAVRYTAESRAKGQRASGAVAILVDLFHGFLFATERSERGEPR